MTEVRLYGGGESGLSAYEEYVLAQEEAGRPVLGKEAWLASLQGPPGLVVDPQALPWEAPRLYPAAAITTDSGSSWCARRATQGERPSESPDAWEVFAQGVNLAFADQTKAEVEALGSQKVSEAAEQAGAAAAEREAAAVASGAAQAALVGAQAARDEASAVAATVGRYASAAAGLADTSVGQTFWVYSDDYFVLYRHDAGPVAFDTGIRLPLAPIVDAAVAAVAAMDARTAPMKVAFGPDGHIQITDAAGAELLGFDSDGKAILRLSTRVLDSLREVLGTYLLSIDASPYPSLRAAGGIELLGFDADGRARFAVSDDVLRQISGGLDIGGIYDPVAAGLLPSPDLYLLGDSMSTASVASGITAATGKALTRFALGGQTAYSMAVAMGAIPLTLTLTGNSIPASGGVVVTARNTNILNSGGSNTGTFRCTIAGVAGLMTTDSGGVWTFTRDTAGSAVAVAAGVQAVLDAAVGTAFIPGTDLIRDRTLVIRLGRNGLCDTRANRKLYTLDPLRAIIARLTPLDCRVLVVSPYNARAQYDSGGADLEGIGTAAYTQRLQLNAEIAREFPRQWVDMRSWAVQSAIYDLGLTPTADDLADMAKDCIPRQLFSAGDNVHVNTAMQSAEGQFLGQILNANRW